MKNIKKLLITTATIGLLASSALAESEMMFYVKAAGGAQTLHRVTDKTTNFKLKSKASPLAELAVGYSVMDNVRADLAFTHYFESKAKKSGDVSGRKISIIHKPQVNSLMLNAYVDMFDASVAKVFLGAGAGLAQVKEKISADYYGTEKNIDSLSVKKKNNFAYALTAGASAEVSQGVNAELAYSWRDFGKTKSAKYNNKEASKSAIRGHHLTAGIRFDM